VALAVTTPLAPAPAPAALTAPVALAVPATLPAPLLPAAAAPLPSPSSFATSASGVNAGTNPASCRLAPRTVLRYSQQAAQSRRWRRATALGRTP
jgi:hypothetical protein